MPTPIKDRGHDDAILNYQEETRRHQYEADHLRVMSKMLFGASPEVDRAHSEGCHNGEGTSLAQSREQRVYRKAHVENDGTKPSEPQQREEANIGFETTGVPYLVVGSASREVRNKK